MEIIVEVVGDDFCFVLVHAGIIVGECGAYLFGEVGVNHGVSFRVRLVFVDSEERASFVDFSENDVT